VGATFRVALLIDHGGQYFHADKKEVGKGNLVVPAHAPVELIQIVSLR
jgi:hypothetical protein